ncbi:MAG: DUF4153 domain-containing protein [Gemmatimonadales bacterium]
MTMTQSKGLGIVGAAVLLGILGDALLRATPWGINAVIWMAVAVVAGWALLPGRPNTTRTLTGWPVLTALFFAACIAWRDSEFLAFWNSVAVLMALSLAALQVRRVRLRTGTIIDYVKGASVAGVNTVGGALLISPSDLPWHQLSGRGRQVRAVTIGLLLAAPVLLVFGGLLASADPGFERIVRSVIDLDFSTLASHLVLGAGIAWMSAGFLRPIVAERDPVFAAATSFLERGKHKPTLGIVEIGIPLGALMVIFLVFVALQARYLFGGETVILATAGLSYAEYARTGFFQLVVAAALLLPVLLAADWALKRNGKRDARAFRILAIALLVSIGLIMLSALHRMSIYMDAYGLTEDRFYATAFMGWVGLVLAYFGATVLKGRRDRFAFGAVARGFGLLAVLNTVNPDAAIVRVNLARAEGGNEFDMDYATRLSADAIPRFIERMSALTPEVQCEVLRSAAQRSTRGGGDWRTWNLARSRAKRALSRRAACPADDTSQPAGDGEKMPGPEPERDGGDSPSAGHAA